MTSQKRECRRPASFYCEEALITSAKLLSVRYLGELPVREHTAGKNAGGVLQKTGAQPAAQPGRRRNYHPVVDFIDAGSGEVEVTEAESPDPSASLMRSLDEIQETERQRLEEERRGEESDRQRAERLRGLVEQYGGGRRPDQLGKASLAVSMEELMAAEGERVAQERAAEEAQAAALEEGGASSVIASLEELQQIERTRVAQERAAEEAQAVAPPQVQETAGEAVHEEAEEGGGILEIEAEAPPGAAQDAAGAEDGAAIPVYADSPGGSREITLSSISVESLFGLPWSEDTAIYTLSEQDLAECKRASLDDRVKWLLPVPPADTSDKAEKAIIGQFAADPQIWINGKSYYVFDGGGFANARRAARMGRMLYLWTEAVAQYDFLGEATGKHELRSGIWPLGFSSHKMSRGELDSYSALLPEGKPVWIHPVPDEKDRLDLETVMGSCATTAMVTLGGREYFLFAINDIEEWKSVASLYQKVRMATRRGDELCTWPESENGLTLLMAEQGFSLSFYGMAGPPLSLEEEFVTPYDNELDDIKRLYCDGKEKWLCPLPERLGETDADMLNFLVDVSNKEIGMGGRTPLVSLEGRWYIALRYGIPEARMTIFEDGKVHVNPKPKTAGEILGGLKERLARKRLEREPPRIVLPTDPAQRKPYLDLFPEGVVKYLYYVDPAYRDYEPKAPHITLNVDGREEVFIVLDWPREGATAVRRTKGGISILSADDNGKA